MSGFGYVTPPPGGTLTMKEPASYVDYTENLALLLADPVTGLLDDPMVSLTLATAPSGTGELVASRLSVDQTGLLMTFWLAGGMPGRNYTLSVVATTQAGRVLQALLGVLCDPLLASRPLPAPPSPGFSTPIIWPA
jgi:hypothetical protein